MNESTASGNAVNSTARVRLHREKLRKDCTRLDVTIGADVAAKLKSMAKQRGVPLWEAVQDVIEALPSVDSGHGNG